MKWIEADWEKHNSNSAKTCQRTTRNSPTNQLGQKCAMNGQKLSEPTRSNIETYEMLYCIEEEFKALQQLCAHFLINLPQNSAGN